MTLKTASLLTLGLLALPAAGVLVTLARGEKPRAHAESPVQVAEPTKAHAKTAPTKSAKAKTSGKTAMLKPKAKPKHHVVISGARAQGSDLGGKLSWSADQTGSTVKNPCAFAACLDPQQEEKACAKGTTILAKKTTVTKSWGAGIDWNLLEDDQGVRPLGKTDVKGLSFSLDAKGKGVNFLFGVRVNGVEYCTDIRPGSNRIAWKNLRRACTEKEVTGKRDLGPLLSSVTSVHWYAQATRGRNQKYDFCVSKIKTL